MSDKKTLMSEVLPTPDSLVTLRSTPRQRAIKRLKKLTKSAATAAAATNLASCIGFGVVDPLPPPTECRDVNPANLARATVRLDDDVFVVTIAEGGFAFEVDGTVNIGVDVEVIGGELISTQGVDGVTTVQLSAELDVAVTVIVDVLCDAERQDVGFTFNTTDVQANGERELFGENR